MYHGFNLKLRSDYSFSAPQYEIGRNVLAHHKTKVDKALTTFSSTKGRLDASKMQANWFPQVRADVFVSHSHQDEQAAIGLAGWLKAHFGLIAFVDSCVWGYSDELLRAIDDAHCKSSATTYDYARRNRSTSHVHMMLSVALTTMMDACECVFFLNTPSSILPADVIGSDDESVTLSPWIYSEIEMTKLVRRRSREEHRFEKIAKEVDNIGEGLVFQYGVGMNHLSDLTAPSLHTWQLAWTRTNATGNALDVLYAQNRVV